MITVSAEGQPNGVRLCKGIIMATSNGKKNTSGKRNAGNSTRARKTSSGTARAASSRSNTKKNSSRTGTAKRSTKAYTGTAKKSGKNRSAGRKEYVDYSIFIEILLWILIALTVFSFISMFGLGGRLGAAIAGILGGCFGLMGYAFPFTILIVAAFLISNSGSHMARVKACGGILLFIVLCAMMQLGLVGYNSGYTLAQYFEAGQMYQSGGGAAGGAVVSFLAHGIGVIGTWLVLIVLLIIALILMTQRSVIHAVSRAGRQAAASAKAGHEERSARREEYRQERERERARRQLEEAFLRPDEPKPADENTFDPDTLENLLPVSRTARRQKPVSGVTDATQLDPVSSARPVSGEVHEIHNHKGGSFFPSLTAKLGDESTDTDISVPASEPGAMSKLRGSMKKKGSVKPEKRQLDPVSQAGDIDSQNAASNDQASQKNETAAIPDDIFKNAFNKGERNAAASSDTLSSDTAASGDPDDSDTQSESLNLKSSAKSPDTAAEDEGSSSADTTADKSGRSSRKSHVSQEELQKDIDTVAAEIEQQEAVEKPVYVYPQLSLLQKPSSGNGQTTEQELRETAAKLQKVFETFRVNVHITDVTCGPSVTRYELTPELGVKVSKIVSLQDDIKLNLAAQDIRIEAPIPGKAAVGIEVPNKKPTGVLLRELLESDQYQNHKSKLAYVVGKDIAGNIIVSDIAKMPHLLIAGATGSGKSVFIHTLIMSILYRAAPDEVKLIMIDPKVVELSVYNGIPHLFIPVVTDPKKAAGALNWAVTEMMKRYEMFAKAGVRDLKGYNKRVEQLGDVGEAEKPEKLPQIVIIVDELADLMMVASADVEDAICRLAQLARAAGIHLVIATQRPSVDVITGLIKANMPSRIALSVSSGVDSRTVLDQVGAEKLLGNGDMLFAPQQYKQPLRLQGAYISDGEVAAVTDFLKEQNHSEIYEKQMQERLDTVAKSAASAGGGDTDTDELFAQAGKFIIEKDKASIGMLQRWFKIGFNRAARIMDQLSDAGVVGPEEGTKPRKVLMSAEEFENYLEQN